MEGIKDINLSLPCSSSGQYKAKVQPSVKSSCCRKTLFSSVPRVCVCLPIRNESRSFLEAVQNTPQLPAVLCIGFVAKVLFSSLTIVNGCVYVVNALWMLLFISLLNGGNWTERIMWPKTEKGALHQDRVREREWVSKGSEYTAYDGGLQWPTDRTDGDGDPKTLFVEWSRFNRIWMLWFRTEWHDPFDAIEATRAKRQNCLPFCHTWLSKSELVTGEWKTRMPNKTFGNFETMVIFYPCY